MAEEPIYLAASHIVDEKLCVMANKGKILSKKYLCDELDSWARKDYWQSGKLKREPILDAVYGPSIWRYLLKQNYHAVIRIEDETAYILKILPFDKYAREFYFTNR